MSVPRCRALRAHFAPVLLALLLGLGSTPDKPAPGRASLVYGFVHANVWSHDPSGRTSRVKAVSEIFAYCWSSSADREILASAQWDMQLRQAIRNAGYSGAEVSYIFVEQYTDRERTERQRARALAETNYRLHLEIPVDPGPSYVNQGCR